MYAIGRLSGAREDGSHLNRGKQFKQLNAFVHKPTGIYPNMIFILSSLVNESQRFNLYQGFNLDRAQRAC